MLFFEEENLVIEIKKNNHINPNNLQKKKSPSDILKKKEDDIIINYLDFYGNVYEKESLTTSKYNYIGELYDLIINKRKIEDYEKEVKDKYLLNSENSLIFCGRKMDFDLLLMHYILIY